MKKESSRNNEAQLLELLKRVLPKATSDVKLAGQIYDAVEQELRTKNRVTSFEKFCSRVELPDLEPQSVETVKQQFETSFQGADVTHKPNKKDKVLAVEVALPEGGQFSGLIKVNPNAGKPESEEQEIQLKFIPFPIALPGDKELVWLLAKHETLSHDEAAMALFKIQEDFWASKTGQKLLRDRVERSFPEFISRVPAGALKEAGLKRHYKTPEPVKVLDHIPQAKAK